MLLSIEEPMVRQSYLLGSEVEAILKGVDNLDAVIER